MPDDIVADVTRDAFFGGRLNLSQPAKGHRSGTDAVLLAASVPRAFAGRVLDVGAGVGAVGLGIARLCPSAEVTLVENDPTCVVLAARNIADNRLGARARVAACDVLSTETRRTLAGSADLLATNPPFYRAGRVRAAADAGRRAAHVLPDGATLADWLEACVACLAPRGSLVTIHPAEALPEMLAALHGRLGDLRVLPVQPRAAEAASRVLLRGRLGSRAPFRLAPALVLHEGQSFTKLAAAVHAGDIALDW